MKLFVWKGVYELTGSYHNGGGVIAVATTVKRARELITETSDKRRAEDYGPSERYDDPPDWVKEEPDHTFLLDPGTGEHVTIFPDMGCC